MKLPQPLAAIRRLSTRRWRPRLRSSVLASSVALTAGVVLVIALAGWRSNQPGEMSQDAGGSVSAGSGPAGSGHPAASTTGKSVFSGIILPDLLIVLPRGLTAGQVARLHAIRGVRKMITFDGAQIRIGGTSASVIGVNPGLFRSWVPLGTASDQPLWASLAAGDFIAASSPAARLRLSVAKSYQLTGASSILVTFGGAARLGISGVDLVVNRAVSRKLGLVHQVAALISAPGPSIATLMASVRRVLGSAVEVEVLRGQRQQAGQSSSGQSSSGQSASGQSAASHITSYLQLFQASSAAYCPALSWTVLAAIGQIESGDGQNVGPSSAGALGPMQFLPSTWAEWGIDGFGPAGQPDVMDPFDAVPSAARMLCAAGASSGTEAGLRQAIFAYNHADWYVNEVLALAAQYAAEYR